MSILNNENRLPPQGKPIPESDGLKPDDAKIIPVIEEQVHIDKKIVASGKVVVSKSVSEHQETVNIPLQHEEVTVERIARNQYVASAPATRHEGETTIIPVLKEVLVVEKRLLLVEEIHITKKEVASDESREVTLRKEEVKVDRKEI